MNDSAGPTCASSYRLWKPKTFCVPRGPLDCRRLSGVGLDNRPIFGKDLSMRDMNRPAGTGLGRTGRQRRARGLRLDGACRVVASYGLKIPSCVIVKKGACR